MGFDSSVDPDMHIISHTLIESLLAVLAFVLLLVPVNLEMAAQIPFVIELQLSKASKLEEVKGHACIKSFQVARRYRVILSQKHFQKEADLFVAHGAGTSKL